MYVRTVGEQDLNFQVSGMLWQRSLVMRDLETETLWSHILGRGMQGKHKGVELEMLPASMTNWADWKNRHPDTSLLAMARTSRRYLDRVWGEPQSYVFGMESPAVAVSISKLQSESLVEVKIEKQKILLTHTKTGGSIQAFYRSDMTFVKSGAGRMKDLGTGSVWNSVTGTALEGDLKGRQLKEIPGTISYRKAWKEFYPESVMIE